MSAFYAGIGSRETPANILKIITKLAARLKGEGYILRSGGAVGADSAFELGAGHRKQIFLPWRKFNNNLSKYYNISEEVIKFSLRYHPAGANLKQPVRLIMGRNAQQILGPELDSPSEFVICWTRQLDGKLGGTGQAIRIAQAHFIPVFNLAEEKIWRAIRKEIENPKYTIKKTLSELE